MYKRKRFEPYERRTPLKHALLGILAVGGVLAVGVVAPKAISLLGYVAKRQNELRFKHHYARQVLDQMVRKGFLTYGQNQSGQRVVRLTKKGKQELERYELGEARIERPSRWDGKYHVLIFDIKEKKRLLRNELRRWLLELGFRRLQQSVWVYPYPCREVIMMLKAKFKLGKEVLYLVVDEIENDRWLKYDFGLM